MTEKRVYTFGNGKAEGKADMRNLLGGKGANLAEMNLIGVPVPPGFTITTDVCNEYFEKGKETVIKVLTSEVTNSVKHIEDLMNSKFGDPSNPFVAQCSFRSTCLNAWYDGYHSEPWLERRGS